MNKGIGSNINQYLWTTLHWRSMTYSMLVYFSCFLLSLRERKKLQNFKVLLQEKWYNLAISYQIKKGFRFNINQLIWTALHRVVISSVFVKKMRICILHVWCSLKRWKRRKSYIKNKNAVNSLNIYDAEITKCW